MKRIEYFAYGSNMNLEQMAHRCPDAELIGTVRLGGHRLAFAGNGVATILPEPGSHVDGVLWEISAADERRLDFYEGYPRLYGKEKITVTDAHGRDRQVMVYTMNALYRAQPALPYNSYFYGIVEGYRQNGIDPQPVYEAKERTRQELNQQARKGPGRNREER